MLPYYKRWLLRALWEVPRRPVGRCSCSHPPCGQHRWPSFSCLSSLSAGLQLWLCMAAWLLDSPWMKVAMGALRCRGVQSSTDSCKPLPLTFHVFISFSAFKSWINNTMGRECEEMPTYLLSFLAPGWQHHVDVAPCTQIRHSYHLHHNSGAPRHNRRSNDSIQQLAYCTTTRPLHRRRRWAPPLSSAQVFLSFW